MTGKMRALTALSFLLALLVSCGPLPRSAGIQSEILAADSAGTKDFAVYAVDRPLLAKVRQWPRTGDGGGYGWLRRINRVESSKIEVGDTISLLIWDSDSNSLLASAGQKSTQIANLRVSNDGTIFVPYLETVAVVGKSPEAVRADMQTRLEKILPAAQVQLSVASGRQNAVDLVGGVAKPGNYPLSGESLSVLNLISLGGGIPSGLRNPQVKLVRGSKTYGTSVSRLYASPSIDTVLQGGDKVIVEEDKRYFLSLGAAGTQNLFYYTKDSISALEAMSLIGGVSDARGNPQGILVLREFPKSAVRSNGSGPTNTRVVFTLDLTKADGLFSAGKFAINPDDLVLVTESPVTSVQTIFGLIGRAFGVANQL